MKFFATLATVFAAAFSVGAAAGGNEPAPGFTIQQALSAPFPTELITAPAKGRVAWVFNSQGRRNIWIAEPAKDGKGYTARQITNYSDDDGQDVGELAWAPDSESLA